MSYLTRLAGLVRDRRGQDLIEYVLVVALVGFTLLATVDRYATDAAQLYEGLARSLTALGSPAP